jgi:hypothetical protein
MAASTPMAMAARRCSGAAELINNEVTSDEKVARALTTLTRTHTSGRLHAQELAARLHATTVAWRTRACRHNDAPATREW